MINCNKAGEMGEKLSEKSLTLTERLQLRFHLMICKACSGYKIYSKRIDQMLDERYSEDYFKSNIENSAGNQALKNKILSKFRESS